MANFRVFKRLLALKKKRHVKVAIQEINATNQFLGVFCEKGDGWIEFTLPLLTVSEANGGVKFKVNGKWKKEHWSDAHRRHKKQKGMVRLFLRPHQKSFSLPCQITLTRYAPNKLDRFDNLPMSMKWILDACCEELTGDYRPGRADDTDEIDVIYKQVISDIQGVKIKLSFTIVRP